MLYVIHGSDEAKARVKFDSLLSILVSKKKDATLFRTNSLSWDEERFSELVTSQSLFVQRYICSLNNIFENPNAKNHFMDVVSEVRDSENIFILLEKEIGAEDLKKLEKYSEKIQEYTSTSRKSKNEFDIFSLTNAFGRKDRKALWVLYQKALRRGLVAEDIFWRINWQLKAMRVSQDSKSASESGLKPFVYEKSKSFANKYEEKELGEISKSLTNLYHNHRRGLIDFELGLEKIIMSI